MGGRDAGSGAGDPTASRAVGWGARVVARAGASALFLMAGAVPSGAGLAAQADEPLRLTRLTAEVSLDGRPDEAAWRAVPALPLTQYAPSYRGTPAQRTEIRVAYDDRYLYAAGWFFDDEPGGIRINSLYRDRWNGDDAFAIYVDAFNDNQTAKWFGTTPGGIRFDQLVTDDGGGLNGSWDAFWDAETTVTAEGWFAEVRIPFSTLGFQVDERGDAMMGLTVTRLVSRTGERVTFPDIDPRFEFRQPSVAQDVVLSGVGSPRPVYVTPYALTGVGQVPERTGASWDVARSYPRELGVDIRYALAGNLTLDVTANTDFAQVEADDQQVNLDRFSLFFPEKRRFFQEQSGVFDFTLGGSRLFHSRQIGLTDAREPVPVLGGARLVGRVGDWDVGVLNMQTESLEARQPGENFGVARVRRRVLNDFSSAGAMLTTRLGGDRHNVGAGVDGVFRTFGDNYLTLKWAGTVDDADADGTSLIDRSTLHASWARRVQRGLGWSVDVTRTGQAFRPDLGFHPRTDVTSANVVGNWYIFTDDHSFFRRIYPGWLAFSTFRNGDGSLESGTYAAWVQWDTRAGGGGWLEPKLFVEDVAAPFTIGNEVEIPAGRYTYADFQAVWIMPAGRLLRATIDARAGTFFDGTRSQILFRPTWNVSPNLELGADYQWTRLRFDDRGQGTDIHVPRLRIRTALDARASGNAFVQYNSTTDRVEVNLRLRYNFAEGEDLWLVFNEGMVTDRLPDPSEPRLPLSAGRTLILKYTYTFGR